MQSLQCNVLQFTDHEIRDGVLKQRSWRFLTTTVLNPRTIVEGWRRPVDPRVSVLNELCLANIGYTLTLTLTTHFRYQRQHGQSCSEGSRRHHQVPDMFSSDVSPGDAALLPHVLFGMPPTILEDDTKTIPGKRCPLCRSAFNLESGNCSYLPGNIFVEKLIKSRNSRRESFAGDVTCGVCLSLSGDQMSAAATLYCLHS